MRTLLADFVTAIDAEIAFIEKEGGEQSYELTSGQREEKSTGSLYVFLLPDSLRLPEDASGSLRIEGRDVNAMVVSQEGNRLWLLLEGAEELPPYIASARLVVNETELLKKLKERIEELSAGGQFGLAPKVFGKEVSRVGLQAPPTLDHRIAGTTESAIAQCLGSEVTFLWGPPGTGKTFTIAALVACLAKLGKSVLVTSHTHAAVEQALWALVEPPVGSRKPGYLFDSQLIDDGRILKVGVPKAEKIPAKVCLDKYLEEKARERSQAVSILEREYTRVAPLLRSITEQLNLWTAQRAAEQTYASILGRYEQSQVELKRRRKEREQARQDHAAAEAAVEQARQSFVFGRSGRVQRALAQEERLRNRLQVAHRATGIQEAIDVRLYEEATNAHQATLAARHRTHGLQPQDALEEARASYEGRLRDLQTEILAIKNSANEDAKELVRNAAAVFATLTKLYRDRNLINDLMWDTVIIDEASMAMPPLVAYAASRATRRVVIVGDMFQLPPVVRSESDTAGTLLATDVFALRHITEAIDERQPFAQLARLTVQRRMNTAIASVARKLIDGYRDLEDSKDISTRTTPAMVGALGTGSPLVTIDTSGLNPWSGKLPGNLSRFNFISGQVAVELASLYAAEVSPPAEKDPPTIGIVTPYAAQRRFLNKLIQSLKLERWVMAGTVHTFQGSECDVIIFDSVVGEPHWTARFANPTNFKDVRRDLNVAVTRARHQFVFVGDARWLKKHAKAGSGFGVLWTYLDENAAHFDAAELIGDGFRSRVAKSVGDIRGWDVSQSPKATLFTDKDFYPSFIADLHTARRRVVLYTPFIGKTRWPDVEPFISDLRERGVEVYLLHRPLSDSAWREGDVGFGRTVFNRLAKIGVRLVPMSGVHAKTIVIDSEIVYEGSLNWASQVASYEHMWRFESKDMALMIERMLQLEPITKAFEGDASASECPNCGGPLQVVNQRERANQGSGRQETQPMWLGCLNHEEDETRCPRGYLRRVDARAPFLKPPTCPQGQRRQLTYTRAGHPWSWKCNHAACRPVRWVKGDCLP